MRKLKDSKKSESEEVIDEFGVTGKIVESCCQEKRSITDKPETSDTFDCRDNIAASALQALLQLFAHKRSLWGFGLNEERRVSYSYYIADEMYKQRTENDYLNQMAIKAMQGKLVGHWNNTRVWTNNGTTYSFTGFGIKDMPLFVKDCYRIAQMMCEEKIKLFGGS